jgi:hypothetical protein
MNFIDTENLTPEATFGSGPCSSRVTCFISH